MQNEFDVQNSEISAMKKTRSTTVWYAVSLIAVALISAVITFLVTSTFGMNDRLNGGFGREFDVIDKYIDDYAYYDADHEAMRDAALKAYVAASGDRYTIYYNAEDFSAHNEYNEGRYVGIGVAVTVESVEYLGEILSLLKIIKVTETSSAYEKGIIEGDLIYSFHTDSEELFTNDVGVDVIASKIKGEEGTEVTLSLLREENDGYRKIDVTLERRKVEVKSVSYTTYEGRTDIGVVTISQFDMNTPRLLSETFDELSSQGISKAVIDMRDNGGGDLNSVVACASYFLNEDDPIISAEDNRGNVVKYNTRVRTYGGVYSSCSVTREDIGKYKSFDLAVLVNENTASAAELLTAVFRDYELALIVGVNTFGKGTMQTIYSLEPVGLEGGIKITTDVYFPPCGENYDGVGILPDVVVENDESDVDNQLQTAVEQLVK